MGPKANEAANEDDFIQVKTAKGGAKFLQEIPSMGGIVISIQDLKI